MIRKEAYVHKSVMEELKRIIDDSEITKEDDALWPPPDRVGRQELEIVIGDEHISFTTSKIGSLIDVNQSKSRKPLSDITHGKLKADQPLVEFDLLGRTTRCSHLFRSWRKDASCLIGCWRPAGTIEKFSRPLE
ncbi:protein mago nashi homolog 2 isoform X3 [Phocoena sinus]|nr:protein mago nashi homolog 2 isoform X3 [Phocoena sinus]XP_032501304.1 protein mago nashi homolog 2 isoform X3 [Phocoena sinus]XP_032501305.1 protein mago nashi homolog 2 isoform X3 [Phocoena sinus]